ncbi:MAG: OmpH family outer membrane protein [Chlamydiota bacterium]|jgi:outer membrane protein
MKTKKILFLLVSSIGLTSTLFSGETSKQVAVVNFASCITDSEYGKQEQQNLEYIRKQMTSMMEETEKELKDITGKFEDNDYMDSLSPKAEEELRSKFQALQEDYARYQNQFYQVLNQANYQLMQKMNQNIARAAERLAKRKNLAFVMNKEACFYFNPDLEVTDLVIKEMDKDFANDQKQRKLSENSETPSLSNQK